jgi:ferredoxin
MASAYAANTLRYSAELCIGCGMCSVVCPHGVFTQTGDVAEIVHRETCIECGACKRNCPTDAIDVNTGVGCAYAMMYAALTGKKEPTCGDKARTPCYCSDE